MTIGQSDFYAGHPWDSRRVARLDGRKAFAARVGSHVDGRGCFCSTTCCYSKRPTVRALCSDGRATTTRRQQGVVGEDDTVWYQDVGVRGAGDERYW